MSVSLANVVKSYPNAELQLACDQESWSLKVPLPSKVKGWERYVIAVLLECLERFAEQLQDGAASMEVMVSGTVPEGAGLSVGKTFLSKGHADGLQLELGGFCCQRHHGIPCCQWFTGGSEQSASCRYRHGRGTPLGA